MKCMGKREGGSLEHMHTDVKKLRSGESECEDVCARLVFFLRIRGTIGLQHVYVADLRRGCCPTITRLEDKNWGGPKPFVGLGSTIYRIGGEIELNDRYPRDVLLCKYSPEDEGPLTWKKGPTLLAGKPNPLSVVVNGKIYCLAGFSRIKYLDPWEPLPEDDCFRIQEGRPDPVFEVLDPHLDHWEPLPDPPFISLYKEGLYGPKFISHTVVDNTIYMQVVPCHKLELDPILYYYDTKYNVWGRHTGQEYNISSTFQLITENIRHVSWRYYTPVVNNNMYVLSFRGHAAILKDKVFALDLSLEPIENDLPRDDSDTDMDSDDDTYITPVDYPIMGLRAVTDNVPDLSTTSGFVTHIADNMFALYAIFNMPNTNQDCLRVCTFEVSEDPQGSPGENDTPHFQHTKLLYAKNVNFLDHPLAPRTQMSGYHWCQIQGPSSSS